MAADVDRDLTHSILFQQWRPYQAIRNKDIIKLCQVVSSLKRLLYHKQSIAYALEFFIKNS